MEVSEDELITLLNELPNRNMWAIIMLGGGHFAAGIYKGNLDCIQAVCKKLKNTWD